MAKIYNAMEIMAGNHDWDFSEDEAGNITKLCVTGSVIYASGDDEMVRVENLDIWQTMSPTQKAKVQQAYDAAKQAFDNYFLGG